MSGSAWRLGWWAPVTPALAPHDLIDPIVHGPLLAALLDGAPLDGIGRSRLEGLVAAGLVLPGRAGAPPQPRFPVVPAAQVADVLAESAKLGALIARLLAGEWSRLEVEYEPVRRLAPKLVPPAHSAGAPFSPGPAAAFLVVGGLLLDRGVRRQLRREGLIAPPFGAAFTWLAEGDEGAAGIWFARSTPLPGRGTLIRFGRPGSAGWDAAAAAPAAAPALPAKGEPEISDLIEALGSPVARLVTEAAPALERACPSAAQADPGAYLAWAYTLAADAALTALAGRGLVDFPPGGAVAVRVADPVLAAS
jgi:hypothetical protein